MADAFFSKTLMQKSCKAEHIFVHTTAFLFRENVCHRIKIRTATKRKCSLPEQIHFFVKGHFYFLPQDIFQRTEIFCFTGRKYSVSRDGNILFHRPEIFSATLFVFPIYWSLHTRLPQMSTNVFHPALISKLQRGGGKKATL